MTLPPPPFSEPLRLNQIGAGVTRDLEPDHAARDRIARTLDLIELPRFKASLAVTPTDAGWTLSGQVVAHAVQRCGLTLEPLPVDIDESFAIDLIEADPRAPLEVDVDPEDDGPDVVEDGVIDLGVYAVEHLALALDPFPRKDGAVFEQPEEPAEESPFAVLKQFRTPDSSGGA
ncbi:MAG: uncharacterized metal-binding protein YceD (DUF177 family) [Brevundimonas sp.]|jgi:uncharacterized metal-binding protein YceD (DUF177 family)|uniref:YceD family protein n=1 Tax=Brevundimonas sp. TaxID=1871086 RepID=UPI0039E666CB